MLNAFREPVLVAVPTGGQTDPLTRERVGAGGAATVTTVSVVWVDNPRKQIVIDQQTGVVQGHVKSADVAALYQRTGGPDDVDWSGWMRPEVTVQRKGLRYVIVGVSDNVFRRGQQIVWLKLQEGGNAG